jgi:signal transduction histidine kinase
MLRVEVTAEGEFVFVRFIDSGPGILRDTKLFEPLHDGASGSGLGLYISRSIIRGYGGDLRHEPGRAGCCFVFELQGVSDAA